MSTLTKSGYEALYGSSGTSLPNNTTEAITPAVVRQWGQDSADSFLFGSGLQVPASITATASGTDTYTATLSPAISSYSTGLQVLIKFTNANTGAATLNLNTLGAKSIVDTHGLALSEGYIQAGSYQTLVYDGTNFQIKPDNSIRNIKVTVSSSEILALNTTPKTLIAAPGSGKLIQPYSITTFLDYGSAAYATNTNLQFVLSTFVFTSSSSVLTQTADSYAYLSSLLTPTTVNIANQPLQATVQTGDPTAGDSPLYVYITYRIITL